MKTAMSTEKNYNAMLTLAIPLTLEEYVLDFLLLHPAWASGFSIVDAEGMGQGASLLSTMEKVQGRSRRKLVLIVGQMDELQLLLKALGDEIRNPDVAYWIYPIAAFGRLQ
ncbi:MAG: hypothetical protein ACI83P_002719 [Janthinobacterium sp.]|jgi:hypothetical protein